MTIKDVDTTKFVYNPNATDFVEKLTSVSEYFKPEIKNVNKRKLLTYICLMYDPQSELRKTISVLPHRKMMCALTAGFVLNPRTNKFNEEIENMLAGGDMDANRMMAEYCLLSMGMDYMAYTAYARIFVDLVAMSSVQDKITNLVPLIAKVRTEVDVLERKIFGGDEVSDMKRALYQTSKQVSLNLRMEDIVSRIEKGDDLADFNEFPDNYIPKPLRYAGKEISNE
jgi:hypothetical protein